MFAEEDYKCGVLYLSVCICVCVQEREQLLMCVFVRKKGMGGLREIERRTVKGQGQKEIDKI